MFVDSHCHLEEDEIALRAYNNGVNYILNAGKDLDEITQQLEMCQRFDYMFTSAGIHPENAKKKLFITTEDIIKATNHPKVIAIGECGLDYHYGSEYKEEQKEMFKKHIIAAGKTNLPLMIHQREAEDDMITLLSELKKQYQNLTGVIHCFSASSDFAKKIQKLGFYISASGIITFNSADDIRAIFKSYPLEKILIETDSPYLAPVPYRGKTNEPMYIEKTAMKLAEIKGLTIEEIARITEQNFFNLYQKAKR